MHLCGVDCATLYCCTNAMLLFGTAEPGSGCMLNRTYKLTCLAWKSLYGSMCVWCFLSFSWNDSDFSGHLCASLWFTLRCAMFWPEGASIFSSQPVCPACRIFVVGQTVCVVGAHYNGFRSTTVHPSAPLCGFLARKLVWAWCIWFGAIHWLQRGFLAHIHITVISMQPANTETHWRRCNACIQTPTGHIHLCNTPPATIFPIPIGTCAIQSGSESKREWDYLVIRFSSCSFNL